MEFVEPSRLSVPTFSGGRERIGKVEGGPEPNKILGRTDHGGHREGVRGTHAKPRTQLPTSEWSCDPLEGRGLSYRRTDTERVLVPRARRAVLTGGLASRSGITREMTRRTTAVRHPDRLDPLPAERRWDPTATIKRKGRQVDNSHPLILVGYVSLFQSSISISSVINPSLP